MTLTTICSRCDLATRSGDRVVCGADGRQLIEHIAAADCPTGKFSTKPISDTAAMSASDKKTAAPFEPCTGMAGQPGSLVKSVLAGLGYTVQPGCGCEAKCREMNEWGWRGCWDRRAELVDWFAEKAAEIGIVVNKRTIRSLVIAGLKDQVRRLFTFGRRNTPAEGMGQTAVESRSTGN